MDDLKERGLLDSTLIVWMGEFGRTPKINPQQGRDHCPNAWSTVLAGGGIKGGQVDRQDQRRRHGRRRNGPSTVPDFLATVCLALGIDPLKQNLSNVGRPIRIVEPDRPSRSRRCSHEAHAVGHGPRWRCWRSRPGLPRGWPPGRHGRRQAARRPARSTTCRTFVYLGDGPAGA